MSSAFIRSLFPHSDGVTAAEASLADPTSSWTGLRRSAQTADVLRHLTRQKVLAEQEQMNT